MNTKLTATEAVVLKEIWGASYGVPTDAGEISRHVDINVQSVKGIVGSLVKKGLVYAETEERGGKVFHDLSPVFNGQPVMFDGESLIALSDAAKRYIVGLTGESKVSFSRDAEDLMPAVKDILSENLTIQIQ
jgi:hypothetical protein